MPAADPEQSIFLAALELPTPAERAAYLKGACGADPALLANVQELLAAHEKDDGFLDRPPPNATVDVQPVTEGPGTLIGPYKLREQIGEGGMGVVYVAEQSHPVRRKVALKVIKPGMDTKQVVARFEAERQALAMMDHPNIAKVHDGGTTESGRPYFVMELVPGVPVTEYCDGERLSVRQRLELFVLVCRAVQHAHQKGIIHRDLKPSNILVTLHDGVPIPKVIDFGVAKAIGQSLTDKTVYTALAQLVGTPLYMSPEQAEMNQLGVDTRSDVYSLGVLLYELLTGTTPFDNETLSGAGLDEMRRMIREDEPVPPSARVSARLRKDGGGRMKDEKKTSPSVSSSSRLGRSSFIFHPSSFQELDWIVMKSLEKDRSRRYESASAFATDIQRYLDDEPVLAGPPSTMYKFHKFARKHRAALATAVAIAASLMLGTTASAWQAVRATTAEAQANANGAQAQEQAQEAKQQAREAGAQRDEAQRQRDEVKNLNHTLQRTLYAAHMNLAQHAWEAGGAERVRELLDQHRPKPGETDLRGFEWHYLYRLCHAELLTIKGHTTWVGSVVFSPDGKRLASASGDKTVKVWDAQTGQELLSLQGYDSWVGSAVFSPDGKRLAGAGGGGVIKVWDAETGQELLTFNHPSSVFDVAFSPDGKRLASAAIGGVKVWDAQTGQELLTFRGHTRMVISVAFSPDGKRLASTSFDKTLKVWDAQTGQELLTLKDTFGKVAFSPDGKRLVGGFGDKTAKVWDAQTGQELLTLKDTFGPGQELLTLKDTFGKVAFSPDGKRLAGVSTDGTLLKVWDAQTGQETFTVMGHTDLISSVAFSPDGKRLASASFDKTVKVWDAQAVQKRLTLQGGGAESVVSVAFSPDDKPLVSGWDSYSRGPTKGKVWDAQTGQELLTLRHNLRVNSVAFSLDGKRLASGSGVRVIPPIRPGNYRFGGEVKLWDAQTGQQLLALKGHAGAVVSLAFSPDSQRLASTSYDKTVKVWNAQTGEEVFTLKGHNDVVYSVAFSPDGKRLASGSGFVNVLPSEVKVWDAQTGRELLTLKGHTGDISSVAFSPDGKRLASASKDRTVKVWDAQTGRELLTLKGHTGEVNSVAFSPDGKRLASASGDKTVKVWDAQTGQELLTLEGQEGFVNSVAFSPNGHWLLGTPGGTVTIWDATPLPEKP